MKKIPARFSVPEAVKLSAAESPGTRRGKGARTAVPARRIHNERRAAPESFTWLDAATRGRPLRTMPGTSDAGR